MPVFIYTGEDENGDKVVENVTADDRFAVYDIARTSGHKITSIEEAGDGLKKYLNIEKINYLITVQIKSKLLIILEIMLMI